MATFSKSQGGVTILAELKKELFGRDAQARLLASRKDVPTDYRHELMGELVAEARAIRQDAERAFREWAVEAVEDAKQRYRSDPLASVAEETRRNTIELRLGREVEAAKAKDARTGPQIIGGRPRPNPSAWELASKAEQAYLDGDYTSAQLFARASKELGGPDSAQVAYDLAQGMLDQEHPTRRQALADIAKVEQGLAIFERDVNASYASFLQGAAVLAQATGDTASIQSFGVEASRASIAAKMSEFARSQTTGTPYEHPVGALTDRPLSEPTPTLAGHRSGDGRGNLV